MRRGRRFLARAGGGTYADKTKDNRIQGESVDEETSEDQDEEGEECLETADDGNPQGGVDD